LNGHFLEQRHTQDLENAVDHIAGPRHGAEQIEGLDVVESNAYTVASNSTPKDSAV